MSKPAEYFNMNAERLNNWNRRLSEGKYTPLLIVGIGHEQNKENLTVITTEPLSDVQLYLTLTHLRETVMNRLTKSGNQMKLVP